MALVTRGSAVKLVELKPQVVRHLLTTFRASFPGEAEDLITGIIL